MLTVVEFPKKIKGSQQKTTGAVVNAPLIKDIILFVIQLVISLFIVPDVLINFKLKLFFFANQ